MGNVVKLQCDLSTLGLLMVKNSNWKMWSDMKEI